MLGEQINIVVRVDVCWYAVVALGTHGGLRESLAPQPGNSALSFGWASQPMDVCLEQVTSVHRLRRGPRGRAPKVSRVHTWRHAFLMSFEPLGCNHVHIPALSHLASQMELSFYLWSLYLQEFCLHSSCPVALIHSSVLVVLSVEPSTALSYPVFLIPLD